MFKRTRRLQHRLDLGPHGFIDNFNVTVNISHLNREMGLYVRKRVSIFEISSLPGEVKMKIPAIVGQHYLSDIFKKTCTHT